VRDLVKEPVIVNDAKGVAKIVKVQWLDQEGIRAELIGPLAVNPIFRGKTNHAGVVHADYLMERAVHIIDVRCRGSTFQATPLGVRGAHSVGNRRWVETLPIRRERAWSSARTDQGHGG